MSRTARTVPFQRTYNVFLERMVQARKGANLTQREVSARMGMAHSFLSKCETGERRIDVMEFLQLAKIYGKPLDHFLK